MRIAAREAASQIAVRDCSKAAVGERQYKVLVKGEFNTISTEPQKGFTKGFFVSHEALMSPRRDLVLL